MVMILKVLLYLLSTCLLFFIHAIDTLEVWTGADFDDVADTDDDGVREHTRLDLVLRDWMNFLSLGKVFAPVGNSDSHNQVVRSAGVPRTFCSCA